MARPKGSKNKISKMIEVKCDYCNKKYFIYPKRFEIKKRNNAHNYCNYKCMGLANRGREVKEETREKLRIHMERLWKEGILKGKEAWNKNTKGIMKAWNKNRKMDDYPQMGFQKGHKYIEGSGGFQKREKHPFYKGEEYNRLYPLEWTNFLKESIRYKDNYQCQICGISQNRLKSRFKKLDVHHKDYNKKNNNPNNLISLCHSCHIKTNYNRDYWINYFKDKNLWLIHRNQEFKII